MDSSRYYPNYGQWHAPYSPHPPTSPLVLPPPPPRQSQSHPESPKFCGRSSEIGGQHQDYHHYSHRQDLPPKPTVNQPSSYYFQPPPPPQQQHPPLPPLPQHHLQYIPQKVGYEPQRISQPPSSTIPCTESRDVSQSVWAGFTEKRLDSWTNGAVQGRMDACQGRMDTCLSRLDPDPGLNYQYDNSYSSRDSSGVSINRGLDGSSRSRDEFRNLECVRKEPEATRIDGNYHDRGQLKSEPVKYFRGLDEGNKGLSSSVGYGSDRYGVAVRRNISRSSARHEGDRNQRWDQAHAGERILYPRKKADNYHSEIEQYFDRERREESNEPNRTPRKQMQKKSALLRLETPRSHQNGRETDWSRHRSRHTGKRVNSNSFRGREHLGHSDHGLLEKRRGKIPVNRDVSFKSNVMVAKPVASPTNAGVHPFSSMKPRSGKARRELVSAIVGYGKLRTHYSDEALLSEGSRQSTRQTTAPENEKKPDNNSIPSSSDAGNMLNKVRFVDGVVQDTKIKITNTSQDSKAKVLSTVHTAEKISSFCEALKEAIDDTNVKHDSNLKAVDEEKSILKSHEDVLDRKSSNCNAGKALMRKSMEKEEIVQTKTKVNTSIKLPVSWPTAADISGCSGAGIQFAGKSMCSVGSQPCEDEDMDSIPSWNVPMMDVDAGFEEKKTIGSSNGSLGYGEKGYEKSSVDASIYFNSEDAGDQVLAKSDIDDIEDENNKINKNVDSLSPKNDFSRVCHTGPVSSASLEIANVLTGLGNANNSVSGDLANADTFTFGTNTHIMAKLPDSENTSNPSVENVSRKESMETAPLNSAAELADNLDRDESLKTCVKGTMLSLTKVNGSSHLLPVERGDGCSRSDESDLVMAVPSDMCTEKVCTERLVHAEDLGLVSHHPAEVPSSDQFSDSDSRGLKRCFPEPNVSHSKDVTDGSSECLVEQDVSQNASTFCDSLPSSSAFVIETNLALGINCMSGNETVTDAEPSLHDTQPCLTVCKFLAEDRFGCGSSGAIGSICNLSMDKDLEKDPSMVSSCFISDSSVNPCHISPLVAVNEQIQNKISINTNCNDSQGGIMHKENSCAEKVEVDTQEEKKPSGGTFKDSRTHGIDIVAVSGDAVFPCDSLPNALRQGFRQGFRQIQSEIHVAAMVDETSKNREKPKPSGGTSKNITLRSDSIPRDSLSSSPSEKLNGDTVEKLTDVTSDVASQEKYSPNSAQADIYDGEALPSDENVSRTVSLGDSGQCLSKSLSHADIKDHVVSGPQCDFRSTTALSSRYEIDKRKKQSNYSQKSYPRSLPFMSGTKKDANPQTHITKHHTWRRKSDFTASPFVAAKPSSSTLSTQQEFPIGTAQSSSSYVRKGNSLLRQPSYGSPAVALGLPPTAVQLNRIEDKSMGSASMVDLGNTSFLGKTGEIPTLGIQAKPLLDSSTSKVSNAIAISSGKCVLSYSMDNLTSGSPESTMDSATSGEANGPHSVGDTFKTSETLIQTGYASDCQQKRNLPKLDDSNLKRMVYVKRKANQLVAASDIHCASKSQIPPSDGYFKRSKNQLVRNSESRVNQSPDNAFDSQAAATMISERSSSSAFSDSAVTRPYKQSKFSLVWTQNDLQSRLPINHMRYQRILPQLVPWKRVTYWRRLLNSVSAFRNGSLPNISQKLSMMRKRHTVYTRSTNGYSLKKSKVLSITGSHLKWSKSIERNSRKANEEATLAVAAFAKKECEKHSGQINTRKTSRNYMARERIFRFGSLRYRMDSSRRTLQRISDVDSPCSGPRENGEGVKRPFIPKRLVIGNEEYVRVGTGNQLVRDPKKRTRVLANEKVRWSLHNVRLRLAKKKYCQFFTRFGKCNKDDGKCPYVHDPSKIAVCTKFLNGLCANTKCKLTHKVIPERMPDCSYFLQGLCNNQACPYRHVHVNPSAAICDGFLKGYCSDGDKCRKKHSYTCPVFEATGSCSQGSKCKLHHPKNQSKGKKRKRPSEPSQKNARGRYFGSLYKGLSESEPMVVDRHPTDSEVSGVEGLDFITLGATEDESGDNSDSAPEQSVSSDNEAPVSIYNLIRPVALMQ